MCQAFFICLHLQNLQKQTNKQTNETLNKHFTQQNPEEHLWSVKQMKSI